MFGSLRYNIGTARNSNGPVPFACINRKHGNFKPEIPFQNNTGMHGYPSWKRNAFVFIDILLLTSFDQLKCLVCSSIKCHIICHSEVGDK